MSKLDRQTFSRFNQPVPCGVCGKKTTWSEANGHGGLDLCRACFDAATLENDHYDNGHSAPVSGCPVCSRPAAACAGCGASLAGNRSPENSAICGECYTHGDKVIRGLRGGAQ